MPRMKNIGAPKNAGLLSATDEDPHGAELK
jgi:hypothetical protein